MVWLKIICRINLVPRENLKATIDECDELIAIFVSSTRTADDR